MNTELILSTILTRKPEASIHEVRQAHPALRAMSYDHLGLRIAQLLTRNRRDALAK